LHSKNISRLRYRCPVRTTLFGRLARHPRTLGREEGEDRLTEVLAAVLDHPACIGLAQWVVRGWLEAGLNGQKHGDVARHKRLLDSLATEDRACTIRTQFFVTAAGRKRRPDLELRFATPGEADIVIWVEAKLGSKPHTRQLYDYAIAQRVEADLSDAVVVLVAPRADYARFSDDEIPDDVPQPTWQYTASLLSAFEARTSTARFLVSELQNYLREERLMDPEKLTPEHLVAFAHHTEAVEALRMICEQADAYVTELWTRPGQDHTDTRWGETWHLYPSHRAGDPPVSDWTFAWSLFPDSSQYFRDGRNGVPRLVAGANAQPGELQTVGDLARTQLRKDGFQLLAKGGMWSGKGDKIWRLAYPEDVLAGSSIKAQGDALGAWIVESFEQARAALVL